MAEKTGRVFPWMSSPLIHDTITTTIWSSASKSVGFLVPFFIAVWFGISGSTDVFFFAYGIIMFFAGIFTNPIENVIVPFIVELRSKNQDQVGSFLGKIIISSSALLFVTGIALIGSAKPFLSVVTRFSSEQLSLLVTIFLEITPLIILLAINSILSGALNAYKVFAVPAVLPAFRAIISICAIFFLKSKLGIHAISAGYVAGELFRLAILSKSILSKKLFNVDFSLTVNIQFGGFLKTLSYQILAMTMLGFNPVIDKTMASWLQKGSVTILEYADRIYMIPVAFLSSGLIVTTLSYLSSHYYENTGDARLFRSNLARMALILFPFLICAAIVFMVLSRPIVNLIYGYGMFPREKLEETRLVLLYFLIGFVPYILTQFLVVEHIILKKTRTLLIIAFSMSVLNVAGNLILMRVMGLPGIALSTSIVQAFAFIVLAVMLFKRIQREGRTYAGV